MELQRLTDSRLFLRHCAGLMGEHRFKIGNVDVTVVCERPKVASHAPAMRVNHAGDLACDATQISVKATTSEKLGFTGRGEGIAAFAAVLLAKAN